VKRSAKAGIIASDSISVMQFDGFSVRLALMERQRRNEVGAQSSARKEMLKDRTRGMSKVGHYEGALAKGEQSRRVGEN